jgi:hyaluronan synthase
MAILSVGSMSLANYLRDKFVALLTIGSILGILVVWLRVAQGTILWIYSISITSFLIFMYLATSGYKPQSDAGLRPRITVVIPAKNEEAVIGSVVKTVFQSDYPIARLEVIVVDDGSTDGTWESIQRVARDMSLSERLTLIKHEGNYGKRIALASAISRAQGEIVVCIDSDSFVDPDAIRLLVQPFRDPQVAAVCGHGEAANRDDGFLPKLQHYWYAETFRLLKGMESRLGCVSCCSGMLAAYRKTSIMPMINQWLTEKPDINGIDSRYTEVFPTPLGRGLTGKLIKSPGEDRILTAFALSVRDARVVYQSNAIVHTIVPGNVRQFLKQQVRWNRAWMHGTLLASKFMWKKPLLASSIFYLYQFLAILSPVVVILWLVVKPLQGEWIGVLGFVVGTLYVGFLHGLNTWTYRKTSLASIPYRMAFVAVSFLLTLTVTLYGWATLWKMGWVTRTSNEPGQEVLIPQQTVPLETIQS